MVSKSIVSTYLMFYEFSANLLFIVYDEIPMVSAPTRNSMLINSVMKTCTNNELKQFLTKQLLSLPNICFS